MLKFTDLAKAANTTTTSCRHGGECVQKGDTLHFTGPLPIPELRASFTNNEGALTLA